MAASSPIEWVFLDVGMVLMNESRWLDTYAATTFSCLRQVAPGVRREDFDAERWLCSTEHDTPAALRVLRCAEPDAVRPPDFWQPLVRAYFDLGEPPYEAHGVLERLVDVADQVDRPAEPAGAHLGRDPLASRFR